jgi:chromosome segregation protein
MRIKKVSILGFKSFMDRLEIPFPLGISGIVGPNGCGKSNIVDAIRWCLGEQSPKQLRGRQMEDVIFGGAGEKKPLGMAEVSILFENGHGSLPSAFASDTELSVTRRLYRSGESEYLINGVTCRLKDINEIFMDTGLGNRAYSVIGQGRIGAILEQKPEETRVMLEEAAGITKYRKNVESSEKKIEQTTENLKRVEDIMAELERQVRSLKRQAARARRYKSLSEEVQQLELTLYANSYQQLMEESGDKSRSTDDLVQQEVAKSAEISRVQVQLEELNLELEEKDRRLSDLRRQHQRAKEAYHKKEAGLEALTTEIKVQGELEERLHRERDEISDRIERLSKDRGEIQEKIEGLKEGAGAKDAEIDLTEERLRTKRGFLDEVREAYEKARSDLNTGVNREAVLSHESGHLRKTMEQMTDSRSRLEQERTEILEKTEKLMEAADRQTLIRAETVARLERIEADMKKEQLASEELEQIRKRTEQTLREQEGELNVCQSRLSSLQALVDNFEGYKVGVRTIMKARDQEPRLKGHVLGLVADVIQVNPAYEQALESVLADKLQYVIVESQDDGKEAVHYLKERAKGRSSFVPVRELNGVRKDSGEGDGIQFLKDLVSAPEVYRRLIDSLLGETILVDSLDSAISSWRNNGRGHSFVTLDGDMVDEKGVVTGGRLAQDSGGLLARKREMSELGERSATLRRSIEDLKMKLDNMAADLEEKRVRTRRLTDERAKCQSDINELDRALFRLSQELDHLDLLAKKMKEDLERKEREQSRHQDDLAKVEEELRNCKTERSEAEAYAKHKEQELRETEQEFDLLRESLAKIKADGAILREEWRSLARERDRLDQFAAESKSRLESIGGEIDDGRARAEECRRRMALLKEDLEDAIHSLERAEEVLNRADQDRQSFQARIKEEEGGIGRLRGELEEVREAINRARMEESELRFKMNNLVEMTRERFDLDLKTIYRDYLQDGFSATEVRESLEAKKGQRQALGEVNLTAIKELEAVEERYDFMRTQREDLMLSIESLRKAIMKINKTSLERFQETFTDVDRKLKQIFPILFNGGTASLKLTDESNPLESGVLVEVQPPGKKISHMGLLSGGEKALVAMALLFAIYMIKPSPFCLLDEVDAPLDEANIDRFNDLIKEIKRYSQIIMVTHNKRTMEIADRLFGVTMEYAGISKIVSVDLKGLLDRIGTSEDAARWNLN